MLICYILAVNFYSFLLVKSLKEKETLIESEPQIVNATENDQPTPNAPPTKKDRTLGKLYLAGLLGGAITIYACMFIYKYRRSDLLLMILMPIFSVLNVYLWIVLFRSTFTFFIVK